MTDVSALADCENLYSLNLGNCIGVLDVSALAACKNLHKLNLAYCPGGTDVSALAQCATLPNSVCVGNIASLRA